VPQGPRRNRARSGRERPAYFRNLCGLEGLGYDARMTTNKTKELTPEERVDFYIEKALDEIQAEFEMTRERAEWHLLEAALDKTRERYAEKEGQ